MIHGRCLCGKVNYQIDGPVGPISFCHCSSCRRASGSAFAANANVAAADFRLLTGRDALQEFESSPGKFRSFCSGCGSPIYARRADLPDTLRIRAGTLLDDPGSRPTQHFDVASKAVWFTITDDLARNELPAPFHRREAD
ncbi:MAG: GFA family protein [Burkholderiaceae bacterium]